MLYIRDLLPGLSACLKSGEYRIKRLPRCDPWETFFVEGHLLGSFCGENGHNENKTDPETVFSAAPASDYEKGGLL